MEVSHHGHGASSIMSAPIIKCSHQPVDHNISYYSAYMTECQPGFLKQMSFSITYGHNFHNDLNIRRVGITFNTTTTVLWPLSGTARVSQYQKKHSPTHHP